jgi:hypothetical protein
MVVRNSLYIFPPRGRHRRAGYYLLNIAARPFSEESLLHMDALPLSYVGCFGDYPHRSLNRRSIASALCSARSEFARNCRWQDVQWQPVCWLPGLSRIRRRFRVLKLPVNPALLTAPHHAVLSYLDIHQQTAPARFFERQPPDNGSSTSFILCRMFDLASHDVQGRMNSFTFWNGTEVMVEKAITLA